MAYEYAVQGNIVLKHLMQSYRGIKSTTISYTYDADKRLQSPCKKCQHKQNVAEYCYNAFNRSVAKRVMEGQFDHSHSKIARHNITKVLINIRAKM